jgi:hypothetical protein
MRRCARQFTGGRYLASARLARLATLLLVGLMSSGVFFARATSAATKLLPPTLLTPANSSTAITPTPTFHGRPQLARLHTGFR